MRSWRYYCPGVCVCVCLLICTENVYHANTRRHRQEGDSSPTDSRGGPHRFKRWPSQIQEVALCSMWHFALRVDTGGSPTYSRGGPHRFKRWPYHVCGVALCSMWHFALRVDIGGSPTDSRGGTHRFKRWPPPRVWFAILLHVALCSEGNGL